MHFTSKSKPGFTGMITLVIASLATNRGCLKDVSGDKYAVIDGYQLTAFSKVFIGNAGVKKAPDLVVYQAGVFDFANISKHST